MTTQQFSNFQTLPKAWHYLAQNLYKAEGYVTFDPTHAAFLLRKALEEWVQWMYANDEDLVSVKIYDNNLSTMMHAQEFKNIIAPKFLEPLNLVRKLGNNAVHTNKKITSADAIHVLKIMHEFVFWIVNIYREDDERVVKPVFIEEFSTPLDEIKKSKQELLEIEAKFLAQQQDLDKMRAELENTRQAKALDFSTVILPLDPDEAMTRSMRIDMLLTEAGWDVNAANVSEFLIKNCRDVSNGNKGAGRADYVLWGDDGLPLAVVEAKRTKLDADMGREQAREYALGLERDYGRLPIVFYTNGFDIFLWDIDHYAPRKIFGFYCKEELQSLFSKRNNRIALAEIKINQEIAGRDYQIQAIRQVCEAYEQRHQRGALLVMATGTGKTRVAASLVDVLSRASFAKRVLFIADRTALVKQAKDSLSNLLPNLPMVNLLHEKEDISARVAFSTYQTLNNLIDGEYDGKHRFYGVDHFDLIIFDEIHRSVYNTYRAIFSYFDGLKLGLTATPRSEEQRDTYALFELPQGEPTFVYELDEAVTAGHLVPPRALSVPLKFPRDGIIYDELNDAEKLHYEEKFTDPNTGEIPEEINNKALNDWLFNEDTVDKATNVLMEHGVKIENGDKLAKTIVFASSHNHAKFIVERFNKQYPEYRGDFARVIDNYEPAAEKLLDDFKCDNKYPQIAVSVDMLDTGIDVPEVANLVFFKRVYSYTKYWQMVGRGTRLCKDLFAYGCDKAEFAIFDLCENFEFFAHNPQGRVSQPVKSLSARLFELRVKLARLLQNSDVSETIDFSLQLKQFLLHQLQSLNSDNYEVRQCAALVNRYANNELWDNLTEGKQLELSNISHLIRENTEHETAKLFDLRALELQLSLFEASSSLEKQITNMQQTAQALAKKSAIPLVNAKIELLKAMQDDKFWQNISIPAVEKIRLDIRELMKFLADEVGVNGKVFSNFIDELGEITEASVLSGSRLDIDGYRKKITHYLEEHKNHLTIYKLRNNIQITAGDLNELERMLLEQSNITSNELSRVCNNQSLGIFIRSILGLERNAVSSIFAEFLERSQYNSRQIDFINSIVNSFTVNGTLEPKMLYQPPFTEIDSNSVSGLFNDPDCEKIITLMKQINIKSVA